MKGAFPVCLGLSIGLHLVAAGLWQGAPLPSLGTPGRTLQVTVSSGPTTVSPRHGVVAADTPTPDPIGNAPLQPKPIAPAPARIPVPAPPVRNIAVADAPANSTRIAATPGNHANQISAAVRKRLAAYFEYPLIARLRGWEGDVVLGLHLDGRGRMSDIRVVASSGYRILDRSALLSARRANIVTETVGWLAGRHIDLVLPVHYRLIDS